MYKWQIGVDGKVRTAPAADAVPFKDTGPMQNTLTINTGGNAFDAIVIDGQRYEIAELKRMRELAATDLFKDLRMLSDCLFSGPIYYDVSSMVGNVVRRVSQKTAAELQARTDLQRANSKRDADERRKIYDDLRIARQLIADLEKNQHTAETREMLKAAASLATHVRRDANSYFVSGSAVDNETRLLAPREPVNFEAKAQAEADRQVGRAERLRTPGTFSNTMAAGPQRANRPSWDDLYVYLGRPGGGRTLWGTPFRPMSFVDLETRAVRYPSPPTPDRVYMSPACLKQIRPVARDFYSPKLEAGFVHVLVDALKEADSTAQKAGYPVNAHGKLLEQLALRGVPGCK